MENKGFTLVELIITITLIAIISVTIGVSMSGMLSRQDEKRVEEYNNTIEEAACVYAEINNIMFSTTVEINTLIQEGLLSSDLNNPVENKPVAEYGSDKVNINWSNGKRTCLYEQ